MKESVGECGGSVIIVEDFLFVLLDICLDVVWFFCGSGVDFDELICIV